MWPGWMGLSEVFLVAGPGRRKNLDWVPVVWSPRKRLFSVCREDMRTHGLGWGGGAIIVWARRFFLTI